MLGSVLCGLAVLSIIDRIISYICRKRRRHWCLLEARRIWSRLRAELGKVKVLPSVVPHIHGFVKTSLGVKPVKDNKINGDRDNLDNNLNEGANQCPTLP